MSIPINHVILIPLALGLGFFMGWRLGAQNMLAQWQKADKKRKRDEDEAE